MINRLIQWSLRNRFLVACATLFIIAWGWRAVVRTPVDAIPDLSENQVIVFADWMGRSPQEVEDQVTYPLSVNLQGLAGVKTVRATSMFGFSLITVIFEDRIDNYFARSRVLERLNYLGDILPASVVPKLGPDATGLGWVFQYYLQVDPAKASQGGYDLGQLRSLQDWFIRYQLNSVQGVAEVGSIGGFVRQYQIEVSSAKLRAARLPLEMVMKAVGSANLNVGGKVIEENGMEFVVRGVGLVQSVADLEQTVLMERDGTPIYLKDVATVQLGGDFRRGTLDVDGREVVGGTVVMRTGENAMEVIRRVKAKIAAIGPSLPPGVSIRSFYDRSELIDRTIDTLRHALVEEMILVTLAHIVFLFHFRSILIVTLPLPLSILISFILMREFGISSNIMSLSGIAIAIGVLVDAGIVMTENVIRHCEQAEAAKQKAMGSAATGHACRLTAAETWPVVLEASRQVGRPIFFAMVIIILAFIPVFSLTGQEGKLFHPLAFTKTFAMIGSTLLAVTVVPALCALLVRGPFHSEDRNWIMRFLMAIYNPVLDWALRWRKTVITAAALVLSFALLLAFGLPKSVRVSLARFTTPAAERSTAPEDPERLLTEFAVRYPRLATTLSGMGTEFMPPLNEGSLLFMPVLLPSTSLTEVKRIMAWQDQVIRSLPEVESVGGKLGRAETATDPAPVEMIETTIMLKPEYIRTNRTVLGFIKLPTTMRHPDWRKDSNKRSLIAELTEKLSNVPGYVPGFLQPIENRILMISTGIRAQVGIKIMGERIRAVEMASAGTTASPGVGAETRKHSDRLKENLEELQRWAFEAERIVREVPGAIGVAPSRVQGKPYVEVEVDRVAMARFGLRAQDVLEVVEAGIGGKNVSTAIEGRERYPIQVRLERAERDDLERLGDLLLGTPSGRFIPLGQVATIRRVLGPSEIASENGQLRVFVQANVQGRDLGSFVQDIRTRLERDLTHRLPPGITIEYSGQFEDLLRARSTLTLVFPAVLLIIFILLYVVYHSAKEAAHVILAVPFALSGGVFLQYALGYNFSVAVWVGYIALFGTAIQTGVVMVVYLEEMLKRRQEECAAAGRPFTREELVAAIKDGARLRLRPKVMTVATIIASLLPIMWSHQTGAEVMKPLATPVIGGMISSLLHILVVTPVLFAWIREREMKV